MMSSIRNKLLVTKGDITKLAVDVIVNAANSSLLGGGGVDGAIHAAAGPELLEECKRLNGCKTAVIHTVGPIINLEVSDSDKQLLSNCYKNSMDLTHKNKLKSIAFPCISTGIYHFPKDEACQIALTTIKNWFKENGDSSIDKIIFCVFNEQDED
uniref:Macro domain-containing protein n=1 Tax=Meloidogyne incognita TaxID=6306 RepID=A0A914LZX3_MELIC